MKITLITAFPELLRDYLATSILGRGIASKKLEVRILDLRDYAEGRHRQIDDFSFGGGGMVLMAEPLTRALESASQDLPPYVLYPSPQGVAIHQELVEQIAQNEHIAIVCGHYEGLDERFVKRHVHLEVSLGDFVLTGGELPALALVDALARLIPGVVGKETAVEEDSFYSGMLDHAHYTRPATWRDEPIPTVLSGGNAADILHYRRRLAAERTLSRRPDILSRAGIADYLSGGIYVAWKKPINGLGDLNEMESIAATFGVKKILVLSEDPAELKQLAENNQEMARKGHVPMCKTFTTFERALAWVHEKEKKAPHTIFVADKPEEKGVHWLALKRQLLEQNASPLFIFGEKNATETDSVMCPIRSGGGASHLPIQSSLSIVLDRFFGWR